MPFRILKIFFFPPAAITAATLVLGHQLGLVISSWGWINLVTISFLTAYVLKENVHDRHFAYAIFGKTEPPPKPDLIFWVWVTLLFLVTIGCSDALLTVQGASLGMLFNKLSPSLSLAGPLVAFFGLFAAYQKQRTDRQRQTSAAIQIYLYNEHIRSIMAQLKAFRRYCRDEFGDDLKKPLPLDRMTIKLGYIPENQRPDGHLQKTLGDAVDEFFNALDLLAFGVRQGEMDFRSVEMILRQRLVKNAHTFRDYICKETEAKPIGRKKQGKTLYRSTTRTWEHYLWLVANLDILADDGIDPNMLVRPPLKIVSAPKA